MRAHFGAEFLVDAQNQLDALRAVRRMRIQSDLLHVADGHAVQTHRRSGRHALHLRQISVEAIFWPEYSRAGDVEDGHRQNEQPHQHEKSYAQLRPRQLLALRHGLASSVIANAGLIPPKPEIFSSIRLWCGAIHRPAPQNKFCRRAKPARSLVASGCALSRSPRLSRVPPAIAPRLDRHCQTEAARARWLYRNRNSPGRKHLARDVSPAAP